MIDKHFLKGIITIGFGQVTAKILGVFFLIIITWFLTTEEYGYVRYVMAFGTIATFVVTSGYPSALIRYLGKSKDDITLKDLYFSNTVFITLFLFLGTLLVVFLIGKLDVGVFLVIFGLTISSVCLAAFSGLMLPSKIAVFSVGNGLAHIGLIILLYFSIGQLHPLHVLAIYAVGYVLIMVGIELLKPTQISFRLHLISTETMKELSIFALPITVGTIGYTLLSSVDVIFIEHFLGLEQVGIYSVAKTLTVIFMFVPQAFTTILMPKIAGLKRGDNIKHYFKLALAITLLISFALLGGFYFFGTFAINLLFGERYLISSSVLFVLSVGMVFSAISWILAAVWVGIGKPSFHAKTMTLAAIVNIIGNIVLTPRLGIIGTSLSFTIAYFINLLLLMFFTYAKLYKTRK